MTLTAKELASKPFLDCHVDTVRRMARLGSIPSIKVGSDYRFDWDEVKLALTPVKVDPWANPRARRGRR